MSNEMSNEKLKQLFNLLFEYEQEVIYGDIRRYCEVYIQCHGEYKYIDHTTIDFLAPKMRELDCASQLLTALADRLEKDTKKEK